jgi:hypothetical protein
MTVGHFEFKIKIPSSDEVHQRKVLERFFPFGPVD